MSAKPNVPVCALAFFVGHNNGTESSGKMLKIQKLFSNKIYNPLTVLYHTFYDLKFLYEINPQSFLPPPTVKSALLSIERKQPLFNFELKVRYLDFVSFILKKPGLSVRTALKSIFRKKQVRSVSFQYSIKRT